MLTPADPLNEAELAARPAPLVRLTQFYRAARKGAWNVDVLGWNHLPPVPRAEEERWRLLWASVVGQQLQADRFAIEAATQLLLDVEEPEAILYYTTMVQDEARHVEGWTRLTNTLERVDCHDPYLAEMGQILLEGETIEERVLAFQVVFEGTAILAFKDIAAATESTVLGEMASRLVRDDSIHHNSGMAYAEYLLGRASPALKRHVYKKLLAYMGPYLEHVRWRPPARRWLSRIQQEHDRQILHRNSVQINRVLTSLGLPPPFDL